MRVLGLDPGSRVTGYGVIEVTGGKLRPVAHGNIRLAAKARMEQRLSSLTLELRTLVGKWSPDVAVLETPFSGINSRSLIVLAQARGALLAAVGESGLMVYEYSPAEIKAAVTGYGRADKDQVAKMVRLLLGLHEEVPSRDATDALAVAICYSHRKKIDAL